MFGLLKDILDRTPVQPVGETVAIGFGSQAALRVDSAYSWGTSQTAVVGVARGHMRTGGTVVVPGVGAVHVNFIECDKGPVEAVRAGQVIEAKLMGVSPNQIPIGTVLLHSK